MVYRGWVLAVLVLVQVPAFALQEFAATQEELAMMPPYCAMAYGQGGSAMAAEATAFAGCPSLRHYCDGLKSMIRVERNRAESGYWLGVAVKAFDSVVQDQRWASCPLLPEAHVSLGKALLRQSRSSGAVSAQAVSHYMKALELRPDYVPAYYALSDYYARAGEKKKALTVVEDGLRHAPDSGGLLRRFTELGGKTPPAPVVEATPPAVPEPTQAAPVEEHAAPERAAPPASSREPQKLGTPSNPWCRFCPPE